MHVKRHCLFGSVTKFCYFQIEIWIIQINKKKKNIDNDAELFRMGFEPDFEIEFHKLSVFALWIVIKIYSYI